jgi:DNA-binding NarL/FixJ family response regulator
MLARTKMQMQQGHTDARVLIVDDQPSFRRAARSVVELTPGFELVGEAETGEASVAAARALQPDLVLMDVHLPGIDGLEASRRILAASDGQGPVIFLLSTCEAADYTEEPTECGALAYLTKAEFGSERLSSAWAAANASASGSAPTNSSGTRP